MMHISTLLTSLGVFMAGVSAQWTMPAQFTFNQTADFHWKVVDGINIVSISVLASLNPSNIIPLPMGWCKVMDIEKQKCSQYVNNGTASLGGSYAIAAGLSPGVSYFISIAWITTDRSETGTANSPSFQMAYPPDPNPPSGARTSTSSPTETTYTDTRTPSLKQVATSTKTIQVSLATQPSSTLLTSTLPPSSSTPSSEASLSHTQKSPHALTIATKVGIALSIAFTLSVTCLVIYIRRSSLTQKHNQNPSSAHNMDDNAPFTRVKDDPSMKGSISNQDSLRNCGVPATISELDGEAKELKNQQNQASLRGARGVDLMTAYPQAGYTGPTISSVYPSLLVSSNGGIMDSEEANSNAESRMPSELDVQRMKHEYQPGVSSVNTASTGTTCCVAGSGTVNSELGKQSAGDTGNRVVLLPPPVYPGETPELDGARQTQKVQDAYGQAEKRSGASSRLDSLA